MAEAGKGDDRLAWGVVKGFVDGSLGSTKGSGRVRLAVGHYGETYHVRRCVVAVTPDSDPVDDAREGAPMRESWELISQGRPEEFVDSLTRLSML